jgi:hypothetical protein
LSQRIDDEEKAATCGTALMSWGVVNDAQMSKPASASSADSARTWRERGERAACGA